MGRKKIPAATFSAEITDLTHDGRGIAKISGKIVFINNALVGETVEFRYRRIKRGYDEGLTEKILIPSEKRVEQECEFFNICGGCSLQHLSYPAQIALKQSMLLNQFNKIAKIETGKILAPIQGKPFGYRRKARLGVKKVPKKGGVLVGFREKTSNFITVMQHCKTLHPKLGSKILELRRLIEKLEANDKIAQIEAAITRENTVLVFRNLSSLKTEDKNLLDVFGKEHKFKIYLQPAGPDSVQPLNAAHKVQLFYKAKGLRFEFDPLDFTQVNFGVNSKMINLALELLDLNQNDMVLDLFCGIGNFSLPIATRVHKVLGLELSKNMVEKARHNASINKITNASFIAQDLQMDAVATSSLKGGWNKVVLDPPRSGAKEILPFVGKIKPELILYISCNPETLAQDGKILVNQLGYNCTKTCVIDMFPQTAHVESMALFTRS